MLPSGQAADLAPRITPMPDVSAGVLEPFRALVEAMPDAIVVVDHTSTIVLVNVQTERLFGYTRDELLGEPVDILVPARLRSVHQGHRAGYFRAASVRPMGSGMDLHAARRDGQEFPVEICLSPLDSNTGTLDGLRILVVDDHADGRMLTSLVLTQAGAAVTTVASAEEALRAIGSAHPDALVSDIDLSGEDGYALIQQIREQETEHGGCLPAVALTGYARAEDRARAIAAGFHMHLPKPVEPAALTAAIAAMTGHQGHGAPQPQHAR